jgi:hypothetical protein
MSTSDASAPKREPVDVEQLRELCDKATPGPWTVVTHDGRKNIGIDSAEVSAMDHGGVVANLHITAWKQEKRDARPTAAFIAAARTALPACLDEIEELRAENASLVNSLRELVARQFVPAWIAQILQEQIDVAMREEPKEGM